MAFCTWSGSEKYKDHFEVGNNFKLLMLFSMLFDYIASQWLCGLIVQTVVTLEYSIIVETAVFKFFKIDSYEISQTLNL